MSDSERLLLTGMKAVALASLHGAWRSARAIGTPSTEILEAFAVWVVGPVGPNEKVALEVAIGAAMRGREPSSP